MKKIICKSCDKDTKFIDGQFKDIVLAYNVRCPHCKEIVIAAPDIAD